MLDCISVENMRLSDAYTTANLVPSLELMHRAALGVFRTVKWNGRVAIMVGSGNNGGDGFALACILKEQGIDCTVFILSSRLSADSAHYAALAKQACVPILPFRSGISCLDKYDIIVDCLLGTGFQGTVREDYRCAIKATNASDAYVVSVDINSGMNGDTGVAEIAVKSDITVTIGYVKNGLLSDHAGEHMKCLVCADIGIELVREENKICDDQEWELLNAAHNMPSDQRDAEVDGICYYLCPSWLDLTPINACI